MKRSAIEFLKEWKLNQRKKPLIIRGARQVGKTWLMKEFANNEYNQSIYINFEVNKRMAGIFKDGFDLERIKLAIQIETGKQLDAEGSLLIFDEIQEAPEALSALKYFNEYAPALDIITAGSLLGVALHSNASFPVGKVDFFDLYPMNFYEYLEALNETSLIVLLKNGDWPMIRDFKSKYIQLLKQYYYTGGMPEAVLSFSQNNDFQEVRKIQKRILMAYEQDFSKHAPIAIVPRIRMLWNSIPGQLARENKKFIYGLLRHGARAKEYEIALTWLLDSGLIHKINRVNKPSIPLIAYEDRSAFKLFLVDVGLLAAMGDLDVRTLLEGSSVFTEFKGALTEQFVLQQLLTDKRNAIYYWTSEKSSAEIDFLLQIQGKVFPVEVKAEENLQAKSLKVYAQKYTPIKAIRTSMTDYYEQDWMTNLPLYAILELPDVLEKEMEDGSSSR
jgi:predicted AAA+ superfamily ATPase